MNRIAELNISIVSTVFILRMYLSICICYFLYNKYKDIYQLEDIIPFTVKDLKKALKFLRIFVLIVSIICIYTISSLEKYDYIFFPLTSLIILILLQLYKVILRNNEIVKICIRIQKWIIKIIKWCTNLFNNIM